jgi:hypothetical protein
VPQTGNVSMRLATDFRPIAVVCLPHGSIFKNMGLG